MRPSRPLLVFAAAACAAQSANLATPHSLPPVAARAVPIELDDAAQGGELGQTVGQPGSRPFDCGRLEYLGFWTKYNGDRGRQLVQKELDGLDEGEIEAHKMEVFNAMTKTEVSCCLCTAVWGGFATLFGSCLRAAWEGLIAL